MHRASCHATPRQATPPEAPGLRAEKKAYEERGDFNEGTKFSALTETQGLIMGIRLSIFLPKIFSMCLDGSGSMFDF